MSQKKSNPPPRAVPPAEAPLPAKAIRITSTSRDSAECTPITLRETQSTRITFEPVIVNNPDQPDASVRGHLVFQKKGKNDAWEQLDRIQVSSLTKGQELRLEMRSAALFALYSELQRLYELHKREGVPRGEHEYVEAPRHLKELLGSADLESLLDGQKPLGVRLLSRLLSWGASLEDPKPLVARLEQLDAPNLQNVNAILGLTTLRKAVAEWEANKTNHEEAFWQRCLRKYGFLLSQILAYPVIIFGDRTYVGGKLIDNHGGNYPDFLLKNTLTQNAILVEIKTPSTPLLTGTTYRGGVYGPSPDLGGSLVQVLTAKDSLIQQRAQLMEHSEQELRAWDPHCVVVIGNASDLGTPERRRSFELYRRQSHNVQIITFDELFARAKNLISLLENPQDYLDEEDSP